MGRRNCRWNMEFASGMMHLERNGGLKERSFAWFALRSSAFLLDA